MPMVDVVIPEGALRPEAEARLMKEMTDILIRAEGFHPTNEVAQSVTFVFLHRSTAIYVGGAPATKPRYRIVPSVAEGKYSDQAVRTLIAEVTEAFARAEGTKLEDIAPRVWIFPTDIPEGRWGARGVVRSIGDIQALIVGEHERELGMEMLAERRRAKAAELIDAVADSLRSNAKPD